MKKKKRLVVTGGHLTPALAVIEELKKKEDWEVLFIGRQHAMEGDRTPSVESQLIPRLGVRFFSLKAGRLRRGFSLYTLLAFLKIPLGFFQAFYYLFRFQPEAVLSFGGYVSVPVVVAGWFLKIPVLTHEQTTVVGLATRINAFFARKVAVSWPDLVEKFPSSKVVFTGNPIRKEVFKINKEFWKSLNFSSGLPLVFITAGNQGSHLLNQTVKKILPKLLKMANVFHQVGHLKKTGDLESLMKAKKKLPEKLKRRYQLKDYLEGKEMGTILNKADLVVCRAGANTVTEIAVLGKPALFVPFPWLYKDEQTKNAQMLASLGTAEILPQKNLSGETLLRKVRMMLRNKEKYLKNASLAQKLVKQNAAKKIIKELNKILKADR